MQTLAEMDMQDDTAQHGTGTPVAPDLWFVQQTGIGVRHLATPE